MRPIPEASQRPNASRQNRQQPAPSRHESRVRSNRPPPAASRRVEEPAVNSRRNDLPQQSAARPAIIIRLGPRQIGLKRPRSKKPMAKKPRFKKKLHPSKQQ